METAHRGAFLFRNVFVPLFAILCLAAGVFIGTSLRGSANPGGAHNESSEVAVETRSINVHVLPLRCAPMHEVVMLPCSLEAFEDVMVASELSGRIEAVGAEEGDAVRKGQMIVTCDMRKHQALRDQAAASLRLAELTVERLSKLRTEGFSSEDELDKARTDLETKRASLRLAEIELDKATIRSPIDGILDERHVDLGEYVNPGQPVARVVDISRIKAVVHLPELHVPFVQQGQMVQAAFPYLDGAVAPVSGTVRFISAVADTRSRTYRLEVVLDNPEGRLRPGMIGKVYLVRRTVEEAVAVPLFAVIARDGRRVVAVEQDGVARLRDVTLGITDGRRVQVLSGLQAGERLIVAGHRQLQDGDRVSVKLVLDSSEAPGAAEFGATLPDGPGTSPLREQAPRPDSTSSVPTIHP